MVSALFDGMIELFTASKIWSSVPRQRYLTFTNESCSPSRWLPLTFLFGMPLKLTNVSLFPVFLLCISFAFIIKLVLSCYFKKFCPFVIRMDYECKGFYDALSCDTWALHVLELAQFCLKSVIHILYSWWNTFTFPELTNVFMLCSFSFLM